MALQVWLPLNSGLNNQGLNNGVTITGTAVYSSTGSPIGGCYNFTTGQSITISGLDFSKLTDASISVWVKQTTLVNTVFFTGPSTSHYVIASNTNGTSNIYHSNNVGSNVKTMYVDGEVGTKLGAAGQWHHYTITGLNLSSWTGTALKFNSYSASYNFAGSVCDIRIYDHCLSAKEVKEISKALVLHYKLDETYGLTNIVAGETLGVYNNYGTGMTYTATALEETYMGQNVRRWVYTPVTESCASGFKSGYGSRGVHTNYHYIDALSGTMQYVYWIYYRPHTSGLTAGGTASNIGGWTEIPREYVGDGWWRVGQYRTKNNHASRTQDYIFTSLNWPYAAVGSSCTIDFVDAGWLVSGTTSIPSNFVNGNTVVTDCSGYLVNGNITGTLTPENGSPRYESCTKFGGHNCYFLVKNPFYNNVQPITVAFWFKPSASNNSYNTIVSNTYPHGGFWISVNTESSGCWSYNSGLYVHGSTGLLTNGTWYHLVWQYKGNNQYQWYCNGRAVTTTTSGTLKAPVFTEYLNVGGCQCADNSTSSSRYDQYGSISDLRIYGSVLSADDVAELYHTAASVDNKGNFYCYELKEI